jgi:predicted transposase/invertase (TIGR01784 family)
MQQGMQQKAREDAQKMKEKGYSLEDIADITGLTEDEIKNL